MRRVLIKYIHVHLAMVERCHFRFRLILQRKYHQFKSTRTWNDAKDTHSWNFIKYYEFPTDRLISCIFNIMNIFGTLLYVFCVLQCSIIFVFQHLCVSPLCFHLNRTSWKTVVHHKKYMLNAHKRTRAHTHWHGRRFRFIYTISTPHFTYTQMVSANDI